MNKIEKLHLDTMIVKDLQSAVKSAEITKDIAIKFAEFMFSYCKEYQRGGTYVVTKPLDESKTYTTNELFEEFLKTIE